jgi:hypothetical protein
MTSGEEWPDPGSASELQKIRFQGEVDAAVERKKAVYARAQAEVQAELDLTQEFHKGLLEVAKGSIDRARASADTVQKAATAILAIYTGILGVSFSVTNHPLPSRGVIAAAFLGVAVVCSTVYLAYLTTGEGVDEPGPTESEEDAQMERSRTFIIWARGAAEPRRYWLHVGVVALGVALAFLPAPFVGALPWIGGHDAAREPAKPPSWPAPPTGTSAQLRLLEIQYRAKIAEAAAARRAAASPATGAAVNRSWWRAALAGLVVTFAIPLFTKRRRAEGDAELLELEATRT